jgi:hypothetical protein
MNKNNLITKLVPGGLHLWFLLSNGKVFLLTPQNNWEKYIGIPHSGAKPQNIFLYKKTKTTIVFMESF